MKHTLRSLLSTLVMFLTIHAIFGQSFNTDHLENLRFRNVGPAGMSGRVTAIDVNLTNEDHILVGTASGGVWESKDGGVAWTPIFDEAATQAIGAVKFNQRNPLEIWVGTGEGNPRNSHNSGNGIYRTLDGGKTWKHMGLEKTKTIHRILIDPHDPSIVYVGALGSAWGPNPERGLYKTTDSGKTWRNVLFVNDRTGICDMVMDPQNHMKLIAATWEYGRTPWFFNSGGKGSGIHVSFDGGESWKKLTDEDGLPKGDLGRTGLAIAANKPNIVYALVEAKENGLYKSVDGGLKWSLVSTRNIGNRPFYYHEIYVDPSNENRIWNLWSYVSKSEDGGRTFETILDYGKGVHPDHHAFWISPTDPTYLIDGNDGGVNISRDGGVNWRFVTNLPVGQFYHVNIDNDYPYNIYGGMQDNGSWVGPAYVLKAGGIRNADYREVLFGDGFDIMPNRVDNRYGWAMSQGGNLSYYDYETGFNEYQKPVHPEGLRLRFNWNAALAQNPFHDCGIYYASQFVHKSMDCGRSWEIISPDLTTNDTSKQKQDISGGLTMDATQAENHTTILVVAPSPVDEQVIWVGTDDGNLQLTRDGGKSWQLLNTKVPGLPKNAWIPQIEVSRSNAGEAFVVVNNYRQNDWKPYLYHTRDYGQTFRRLIDEDDAGSFICSVVQDPVEPNLVFLGADDGLYLSLDGGQSWQKWYQKGLPPVQIRDMKIHPEEGDLVLGTFGRAFWVLDDIRPLRAVAKTRGKILDNEFAAFETPVAVLAEYRSVDGIRFTADAEFRGDNRSGGARFTVWKKPVVKDEKKDASEKTAEKKSGKKTEKADKEIIETSKDTTDITEKKEKGDNKLRVVVLDSSRDTVRQFSRNLKDGFNVLTWDMRRDGLRYPSRNDPPKEADPPPGREVLPGDYVMVMTYNGHKDSTGVKVIADPRLPFTMEALVARDASRAEFETVLKAASDAFSQLREAKKTVDLIDKALVHAPDSVQKDVRKQGKEITTQIDSLMEIYMHPEDTKGIPGDATKLTSIIGDANGYLATAAGEPGENARHSLSIAKNQLQQALDGINAFIDEDWQDYIDAMKEVEFDIFGKLEKVQMD